MATPVIQPQPAPIADKLKEFDAVPLFMRSLPDEDTDDVAISALQSLVHDGTPDVEIAQNFKEQGNEYFKGKRFREALGFYSQGIDAQPTDPHLTEALLCNRAACNLELQNYGSVLRDCSKALVLNAKSSKAYYRSAVALLALDRLDDVFDVCDRCLSYDSENVGIRSIRDKAKETRRKRTIVEKERREKLNAETEEKMRLHAAFMERNLIVTPDAPKAPSHDYKPRLDTEDLSNTTLVIPTFFLYPEYGTSDLIESFYEDSLFGAHLDSMFPPEAPAPTWDKRGDYVSQQLVVYAITSTKRLLKVGRQMTLKDVFLASKGRGPERDGLEVKAGCVSFVIVPKGDVERKWVEEFKSSR
ncbi:TPR-like protein [Rickenella mellea]|uniref:TPR-like protein n=1 Tax=Rickenella mellea TaxID=50990 RepID=A0A4R5XGR0_9AGAM|nr:TPR-like protein [Rickenella mellea]